MTRMDDLLFCLGDIIGVPIELKIKPMLKSDPKHFLGECEYASGIIKLGVSEEFTAAVLIHEHMHKILLEILTGEEAILAAIQYDQIKDNVDTFLHPNLVFLPRFNYYSENLLKKRKRR